MSSLEIAVRRLCGELVEARFRFALIGGLAVSVRSEPRFTRDADIAVAIADDVEAETLVRSLQQKGYAVVAIIEQDAVGRLATVRLQPPGESGNGLVLDLLFASSGIEREVVESAETLEVLPGFTVPVARTGHLIALKVLSRDDRTRPQDVGDLRALLARATWEELDRAREALRLIESRGFHRGRKLMPMLDELIAEKD
ncbi:MAG: nucleotidyl transferase AbiEii/AbiGii toxin family protein [Acidobacteriota bacterium]|nr:MAG: nucleotidyl transferase AbiEii/AbiGii toxin family protein [Acidobacteriota bacterium]